MWEVLWELVLTCNWIVNILCMLLSSFAVFVLRSVSKREAEGY